MIHPPLKQPFHEYFGEEPVLSKVWHLWFCTVTDQITGQGMPPVQQSVVVDGIMAKPWQAWFQQIGILKSISEPPFRETLLNHDMITDPWSQWFSLLVDV